MAKITYQDKENVNSLPSVPANNKVSDADMNEIKTIVNGIDTELSNYFTAKYKTLWTGTWSSGSITINETSNYNSFLVYVDNSQDPIPCYFNGSKTTIVGSIILGSGNNNNQYAKVFRANVSGTIWTLDYARELGHNASSNHNAGSNKTIYKIVGLEPIITWT